MGIADFDYLRSNASLPGRFNELWLIENEWDRVVRMFEGEEVAPYSLIVHPSAVCNLNCKWCIGANLGSNSTGGQLLCSSKNERMKLTAIAEEIAAYSLEGSPSKEGDRSSRIVEVTFSGITGEPLMSHDDVCQASETLCNAGIRVGLFTNGLLLNSSFPHSYKHFSYMLISFDAGTSSTYSTLKGARDDAYHRLLTTCAELNGFYKINGGPEINAGYVVNRNNCSEIFDAAEALKSAGIRYLRLKTDIASKMGLSDSDMRIANDQVSAVRRELCDDDFSVVEIHRLELPDYSEEKRRKHSICFMSRLQACIGSDSKLYPCNYHPRPNGSYYGDLSNTSFAEVMQSDICQAVRENLPRICPKVCDPFKNRANRLLEDLYEVYLTVGRSGLQTTRDKLLAKYDFVI